MFYFSGLRNTKPMAYSQRRLRLACRRLDLDAGGLAELAAAEAEASPG